MILINVGCSYSKWDDSLYSGMIVFNMGLFSLMRDTLLRNGMIIFYVGCSYSKLEDFCYSGMPHFNLGSL